MRDEMSENVIQPLAGVLIVLLLIPRLISTVSGRSLYVTPPQREILKLTRGRSDELFVTTNPLSQQTLRPDEFFVPTKFVPKNYFSRRTLRPDEFCVPTNCVHWEKGFVGTNPSSV